MRIMESFTDWLTGELDTRGWSRAEAARRGGISASVLDKIISGYSRPGDKTCRGLARAFGLTTEEVMRYAGLIPPRGATVDDQREFDDLVDKISRLDPRGRQLVAELVDRIRLSETTRRPR